MIILGYPFAFLLGRRGSLYGIGLAIVLGGAYWTSLVLSAFLGKVGVLPPMVAAWAPNVAFTLAGVYLFLGLDT
jgi:lipopolysaccharide export LptBFGC system permease protein LptF